MGVKSRSFNATLLATVTAYSMWLEENTQTKHSLFIIAGHFWIYTSEMIDSLALSDYLIGATIVSDHIDTVMPLVVSY